MPDPYSPLIEALANASFFTSYDETSGSEKRVICASEGGSWGLGGRSYWVTERNDCWFIGTWAPRIYTVPSLKAAIAVILNELGETCSMADISLKAKEQFGLIEVPHDEFYGDDDEE